jgi:hypothetical protein
MARSTERHGAHYDPDRPVVGDEDDVKADEGTVATMLRKHHGCSEGKAKYLVKKWREIVGFGKRIASQADFVAREIARKEGLPL